MSKPEPEKFYISAGDQSYEVPETIYQAYSSMIAHEKYIKRRDSQNGLVSYQVFDSQCIDGESGLLDPSSNPEDILLTQELHDLLHRCIGALPSSDQALIHAIYFEDKTEQAYADAIGMSRSGVNYRRMQILAKLRILMDILGSF